MGHITPATPVKLFIGMISNRTTLFEEVRQPIVSRFGPIDLESPVYPWTHTTYYEKELGPDLKRQFLFFKEPISPDTLHEIKQFTNELEQQRTRKTAEGSLRRINLDPGYIAPSKIVLATTKDYSHRIYLRDGIYAEVTLVYQGKSFVPLPNTYPDFRSEEYIALFNEARRLV
ncbi:MAG: DUF4416 family protein [Nitrospirae bacterium]|nr:DUF4416 family protein [Nitrospirota bacterium]